ncbi:YDG domain-containing protein [Janthinobacterium sp.]|uniref:YDG domain-containing protein n=1 Tax=Janthinobacterium sp. TaxID=1871054 RepID=UPI00293D561B|nr:YDG domain-containing protein [Janthinobacterium sp.]
MNRIYRSIWSIKTGTFVAVSELVKSAGKRSLPGSAGGAGPALKALAASLMLAFGPTALALPTGGVVAAGAASVSSAGGQTTVNQASQNAVLNWNSFNIGKGETVQFVQPNSAAVALNRVLGAEPSSILGSLSANGKVFLVNPNGILFGKGASVNVGGLAASTLGISDADFMAGRYRFVNAGPGAVLNQGSINAAGGYVALLGARVSNEGTISARLGSVALAAGNAVTLDVAGDGLLNVAVNQGALRALVQNGGLIQADGGRVLLSAQAAGTLLQTVVNNTGVIEAHSIDKRAGSIKLLGDMQSGTVNLAGRLDAGAPTGGDGGFVETSAAHVKIDPAARVGTAAVAGRGLAGTWLVDPTDFTIAASGGDMTGATLSSNLAGGNVSILSSTGGSGTAGNVNVNDTVSWAANTLTLNAQNNININTAMKGSGTASLALVYGQAAVAAGNASVVNVAAAVDLPSGAHFSTKLGSNGGVVAYTVINSLGAAGSTSGTDLQGMAGGLTGNYALGSNIDARATSGWNGGAGFAPVGNTTSAFSGKFDGLGHVISGLNINRPDIEVGLFGVVGVGGAVRNVGLDAVSITGSAAAYGSPGYGVYHGIGALVGENAGSVLNSHSGGTVTVSGGAYGRNGGLVGLNTGLIDNSYSSGSVTGSGYATVGGLVGFNSGTLSNSHSSAAISTTASGGGLAVYNYGGTISNSYATGAVVGGSYSGGLLAAMNFGGTVSNSHATGNVSGGNSIGGLAGAIYNTVSVVNSYATGTVTGTGTYIGGLVGMNNAASIANSYATGAVHGNNRAGGLVGYNIGPVSNSYAVGLVTGGTEFGALLGDNYNGTITGSYFNSTVNGATPAIGFAQAGHFTGTTGLTSVQMKTAANFATFVFTTAPGDTGNKWVMVDVDGSLNNAGSALGATYPMLSSEYSTSVSGAHQLQLMAMNLTGTFTLEGSFSAAATAGTTDVWHDSSFVPVGRFASQFTGSLDGKGNTISGLNINLPTSDNVGLFGAVGSGGSVSNVGLEGGGVTGRNNTGGLAGRNGGTISQSYATTPVTGNGNVGGLAGYNTGTISNTYASGAVAGAAQVGGLVGQNYAGSVSTSYSSGAPTGSSGVGGLVGLNYAGSVTRSFWDTTSSGKATSSGGLGMSTANMQTLANFTSATSANGSVNPNWDMASVWAQYDGHSYPLLRAFMTPLTVQAKAAGKTYDGVAYSGGNGVAYSTVPDANLLGTAAYSGSAQGAVNAGSYAITPSGFYSTSQHGYLISYQNGTLTIDPAPLTVLTVTGTLVNNKVYDGSLAAFLHGGVLVGVVGPDAGHVSLSEAGTFASKNVGNNIVVTANDSLSGSAAGNYTLTQPTGLTANITAATINFVSGITAGNRAYDGTSAATLTSGGASFDGMVGGDALSVGAAGGAFANANAGNGKTVSISGITLGGLDAGNYILASNTASATANITPKALTLTGMSAAGKTYDGDAVAVLSGGALSGLVGTETLGFSGQSGAFADANAGNGKAVSVGGVTLANAGSGATAGLAANYSILNPTGMTANITPKALTVSGLSAADKTYNGNAAASLSGGALLGLVGTETLALSGLSGAFANANAGNGKAVTVSGATLGNAGSGATAGLAGNYSVSNPTGLTASVTQKALTVSGLVAANKVYDGNATASLSGAVLSGLVGSETLALSGLAGAFADANAGNGKGVTVSGATLADAGSGATAGLAGNYSVSNPGAVTASITPKALTIVGMSALGRVYDGNRAAALSGGSLSGLVGAETLAFSGQSGLFANKNAGIEKAVGVSGIVLANAGSGATAGLAGNYSVSAPLGLTADVTRAAISAVGGITAANRAYNGSDAASLNAAGAVFAGMVGGDALSVTGASGVFADKNAANGKTVSISGIALAGADAVNYTLGSATAGTTANITPKALSFTGVSAVSKVYDGNTATTVSGGTLDGLVGTETLGYSGMNGAFADKNAGSAKTVLISGVTLLDAGSGATAGLAGNYSVVSPSGLTADITRAVIGGVTGIGAANKVYDGATGATLNAAGAVFSGKIGGDALSVGGASAVFADKNVGTGKSVSISAITLGGADAGNYTLANANAAATASITPKALRVTGMSAAGKVYDGSTAATLSGGVLDGLIGAETLAFSGQGGAFADKNAGLGKVVNVSGIVLADAGSGASAGLASNYTISNPGGVTADIARAALTVNAIAANKVYDGGRVANVTLGDNRVAGDQLILSSSGASFGDKNVGNGKTVSVAGIGIGGQDAGNYSVKQTAVASANITPAALTVTANNAAKDAGQANPAFSASYSPLQGDDTVAGALSGALSFATLATSTSPGGAYSITPSGQQGGNYAINFVDGVLQVKTVAAAQSGVNSAIAMTAVAPSQGNMVGTTQLILEIPGAGPTPLAFAAPAAAPSSSGAPASETSNGSNSGSGKGGAAPAFQGSGSVVTNMLPGLNLTVIDLGVKLPVSFKTSERSKGAN